MGNPQAVMGITTHLGSAGFLACRVNTLNCMLFVVHRLGEVEFLKGSLSVSSSITEHNRECFISVGSCHEFPRAMWLSGRVLVDCFLYR